MRTDIALCAGNIYIKDFFDKDSFILERLLLFKA
jgi:hypothetical protein